MVDVFEEKMMKRSYTRYPCQVTVVRQFTDGHLRGMTHGDHMGFMARKDAITWASSVSESPRVNYTVIEMKDMKTGEVLWKQ